MDRQALVAALRAVHGVADADVDPDDRGGLGTLRLDLEPGVDETDVASQVSTVLREQFGLGVDADRVALVESEADPEADPESESGEKPASEPSGVSTTAQAPLLVESVAETVSVPMPSPRSAVRPAIAKMHLVSSGLDVTASVTLASGTRTATGESKGLASPSGVHRSVATATLQAVEQLVDGAIRVELEHLEITPMGTQKTVVVLLTLLTDHGSESLTGAAAVRDDVRQAVIRATLDALNRRLELLLVEA